MVGKIFLWLLLILVIAGFIGFLIALYRPGPTRSEILKQLPENLATSNNEQCQKIIDTKFPLGSSEQKMVQELLQQGFNKFDEIKSGTCPQYADGSTPRNTCEMRFTMSGHSPGYLNYLTPFYFYLYWYSDGAGHIQWTKARCGMMGLWIGDI